MRPPVRSPRSSAHSRIADVRRDPPSLVVVDTDRALEQVIRRLHRGLRKVALQLSRRDRDVAADLVQEAFIWIWQLDPSRFADDEISYLRKAAVNHMVSLHRRDAALRRKAPFAARLR